MQTSLQLLQLTKEEHAIALIAIEEAAYFKWIDAGRPPNHDAQFWLDAEREWIAYRYVPHRYCAICDQVWDDSHAHGHHQSA